MANKEETSMVSGKAKVTCTAIYGQHVTSEQQLDQENISTGQRDSPRDLSAITGTRTLGILKLKQSRTDHTTYIVWATAQSDAHRIWLISRPTTLLCHLRDCDLHNADVRSRAQQEYHESYSPHKGNHHHTTLPPGVSVQPLTLTITPTENGLFAATAAPAMLPRMSLPVLSLPLVTSTLSTSSSLLTASSTYGSIPASPAMSEMSFSSHHSKRRRLTQSGHYSGSGSAGPSTSTAPPGSPNPAFYWSTEAAWTPADQADWEAALARLTASAGLPLRWIENPEWKKICDCFLSKAKNPSSKVLTDRIIPEVLNVLKASAQVECQGSEATLQCDGWTGENHHHLIGFMMTAQRKVNIQHHLAVEAELF
jgi:hypothetical protein